jgi:hypothetical protein
MAQRIDALVHTDMSAEEAAEVIGCPLGSLVSYGNGYAVVKPAPAVVRKAPVRKPKPKVEVVEMDPALDS